MAPDAMTIPARDEDGRSGTRRQPGPVFSVDAVGFLHMRYTARTLSIDWKDDAATHAAVAALGGILASDSTLHLPRPPGTGHGAGLQQRAA